MKISQLKNIIKEALNDLQEQRMAMGGKKQIVGNNSTEFVNNLVKHFQSTGQKNLIIQARNAKAVIDNPKHPRRKRDVEIVLQQDKLYFALQVVVFMVKVVKSSGIIKYY